MIFMMLITACTAVDTEIIEVTRPAVVATVAATAVPPSPSPTATLASTITPIPSTGTPLPTPTHEPEATLEPTAVATPEPIWPTESIIFVRDHTLQKWSPQSGEVTVLAENVYTKSISQVRTFPAYTATTIAFIREITPDKEYALMLLHLPTGRELEVTRLEVGEIYLTTNDGVQAVPKLQEPFNFTVSPNGRWFAYIMDGTENSTPLFVQEILADENQLSLSDPVLTINPSIPWQAVRYSVSLHWPTENQFSWHDQDAIWLLDLDTVPIESPIAIQPSTNTYKVYTFGENDQEATALATTEYVPAGWSPDGRYLIALETYYESEYRVIERDTNRVAEIPDAYIGYGPSHEVVWINNDKLLHFPIRSSVKIWRIDPNNDHLLVLDKKIQLEHLENEENLYLRLLENNHIRFKAFTPNSSSNPVALYDLNLETDEIIKISSDMERLGAISWSPRAEFALWIYGRSIFLDDLNGDAPVDVSSIFGESSCCWYWYEE